LPGGDEHALYFAGQAADMLIPAGLAILVSDMSWQRV